MIPKRVQTYLRATRASAVAHRTVYTSFDLSETTGVALASVVKAALLRVTPPFGDLRAKYVIAAVPANRQLDFQKIKKFLGVKSIALTTEAAMAKQLKVKVGALTPFGPLYKIPIIIDRSLLRAKRLLVRSGSFTDSLLMTGKEFAAASGGLPANIGKPTKRR